MSLRPRVLSLLVCLLWIGGCSARFPSPTGPSAQASVRLLYDVNGTDWPADLARPISLIAYSIDADGGWTNQLGTLSCTSSNVGVVTALALGYGTCYAAGTTTGSASVNAVYKGQSSSAEVAFMSHTYPALRIVWQPSQGTLPMHGTMQVRIFNAINGPGPDVTNRATWSSSDTRIATMTGNAFTGLAPGNVEITAMVDGQTVRYRLGVPPKSF